jgi:2-amino-4-hydroxy-6-hydroxymethyldihydropteridine diphosphokinase
VGPQDQPDYINAAARIETRLDAYRLLHWLQAVERNHGRVRDGTRWGPRTLDLDILLYGDAVIDEPGLRIPHPRLPARSFVLVPLKDIAPRDLPIPGHGRLRELLAACGGQEIRRLGSATGCEPVGGLAESESRRSRLRLSACPAIEDRDRESDR